jgi:hypothetical protein
MSGQDQDEDSRRGLAYHLGVFSFLLGRQNAERQGRSESETRGEQPGPEPERRAEPEAVPPVSPPPGKQPEPPPALPRAEDRPECTPAGDEPRAQSARKPGCVFVSYRRDESAGFAGRIFDRLVASFAREQVFMDVDNIEPGLDFVEVLNEWVGACDVLLAVIGPNWTAAADPSGTKRLDDPHDFVRIEIDAALRRNVRVIPVLIGGARMPRPDELPDPLRPLTRRQALEISHVHFNRDVDGLVRLLHRVLAAPGPRSPGA